MAAKRGIKPKHIKVNETKQADEENKTRAQQTGNFTRL